MELLDMVEIHDRIAMHAEKTIRVEERLEVSSCFAEPDGSLPTCQSNVIRGRLIIRDIFDPSQAQSFHSPQLPVSAESAAPVVVLLVTRPLAHVELIRAQQFAILPDPERLRSARHQMVLQESR